MKVRTKGGYCGAIGNVGVCYFNANKIITTGGGMVVANNKDILDKIAF
ncbi:DegT/DnrJ/EryC1/StrS family aminotransferase [Clostridium algidicarnis]|uniref:DegT/DnrJ/EryC1/StrS family aminotransferase n=1 Tax=Clostridium algidicarnis TaxID=37659 RepID=A0ABS6C592_9CLOT|nr:DegT/DnrJ/EryC1/StrS family aminotransferase [Clostridium algidicarnis]